MNNDHKAYWKWIKDKDGVVFELIFENARFGMCFYPNGDSGWWLLDKKGEKEFRVTEDTIPEDVLSKIKETLNIT